MSIYCVKPNVANSGGCAIVNANSEDEALRLVNENNDVYTKECIDLFAFRLKHLFSDHEDSKVILDFIYFE